VDEQEPTMSCIAFGGRGSVLITGVPGYSCTLMATNYAAEESYDDSCTAMHSMTRGS
jgi:hypothetical protein